MSTRTQIAQGWHGMSAREQVLIATLVVLAAIVALFYGAVQPLQTARAAAVAEIRSYDMLRARVLAAGSLAPNQAARRVGETSVIISDAAAQQGLALNPQASDDSVRVELRDARHDKLLAWLADLAATSDARLTKLAIERAPAPGRVSAVVEFAK